LNVISLFDKTGNMVKPWADAGHTCWIIDIQHKPGVEKAGNINRVGADLSRFWVPPFSGEIAFVSAFPPCTHLAVSGARWFRGKGLHALADSIRMFAVAAQFCEWAGAPYMIENPVSTISTYWREPDHTFHPFEYAGIHPEDNYTKKTCLWTGGGFVMPYPIPLDGGHAPDNRIHTAPPSRDRADFRSMTPTGFAKAVFEANH
jgi:hypothetical protein